MIKISIGDFRSWLTKLIEDKKGALPNLDDWKLIKEKLDQVEDQQYSNNESDYCVIQNDDDEYYFTEYKLGDIQLDQFCNTNQLLELDGVFNQSVQTINHKEDTNGQTKAESTNRKATTINT